MSEQLLSSLDSAAQAWLAWMGPMTWQLSVLVALLALLTWLLRHRSARLRYALWLLVPIRLVLPPTLALATGWGWWVLPTGGVTVAQHETGAVTTEETHGTQLSVDSAFGQRPPVTFQTQAFDSTSPPIAESRVLEARAQTTATPAIEPGRLATMTAGVSRTWQRWVFLGWVVGVVLLTMRLIYGSVRAARMIRRSTDPSDSDVVDLAEKCRGRMGLRRSVGVRQLADADVPMLDGQRREYGAGIVKVAEMATGRRPGMAMGVAESGRQVKRRLQRILDPRLPLGRRLSWSAFAVLLAVGAVLLPSAARPGDLPPVTAESSSDGQAGGKPSDPAAGGQENNADAKKDSGSTSEANASNTDEQKPAEKQAVVHGIVVEENGEPVEGVDVFVEWYGGGRAETRTDKRGRFELRAPWRSLRGRLVRAVAESGRRQAQQQLPWKEEAGLQDAIRLQLHPARRVELHVVDGAGHAIANAKAGFIGNYYGLKTGKTDDDGRVVFFVPHDVRVKYVYALSDGHGLDYRAYMLPRGRSGDRSAKAPELPDGPVRLTLDGVKPLRVRVVEPDGAPIAGIKLYPWLLKKPDQPRDLNLSHCIELVQTTTDEAGNAAFDWIPHWNEQPLTVWPQSDEHVGQRGSYDPKTGDGTLTIKLDRLVPIRGRVTLPDGSPAAGIQIVASGKGFQPDGFRRAATTDAGGRYEIKAAPNMVYLVIVSDKKWAATPHTGFAVWPGKPVENLDFTLRPATRLFGRVTLGPNEQPVKGQRISVYQYGQDANNMKDVQLPNPEKRNLWVQPIIVHSTSSDDNGNFELFVGAGKFDIRGPRQTAVEKFEITEELEKEFNFHAARPEKGILRGIVVTGDPPQPVSGAELLGIYRHNLAGLDMRATTDESGKFEVERELHRTVIRARSSDGKLAGVVQIEPDDQSVTVPIRPMATATGRLIDATTGEPLQSREIVYGVRVPIGDDDAPFRTSFGGKTTTDAEGHFDLSGLILGQDYDIKVTIHRGENLDDMTWRTVGKVKADRAEHMNLGDLKLSPTYSPPTIRDRIARTFHAKGSPVERFESVKRDAAISHQRVLILFADPDGNATRQFMALRYDDREVRRAFDPFRFMAVDSSVRNLSDAKQLANSITEDLDGSRSVFSVFVTDSKGKTLASADAGVLMHGGQINKDKLLAFLREHTLEPLDARKLLDDALAQAKTANKRLIVQETATWCAPCWLLSRFLEEHRDEWQRDYIWVKMDHRWKDTAKIMEKLRNGAGGGIPWWAVLDADGKVLITSNDSEGKNIGFPSTQSGRAHFRTMLEKTAIRMTTDEITSLVDALKDNAR